MKKVILRIDGMSCSACQNRVEKYLNKQEGVTASVNLIMAQALISYDEKKVTIDDLNRFIEEAGYKSLGIYEEKGKTKKDNSKMFLILFSFIMIFLMYISMSHMIKYPMISFFDIKKNPINYSISLLILSISFLIYGFDILKSGIKKLFKAPNMDSLVSVSVLSSFAYSIINLLFFLLGRKDLIHNLYFESSAMIIFFVKLGRYIDKVSKKRATDAIKDLVTITPEVALLKKNDKEYEVTIDEVKKGDTLIAKPGMKIAVDGRIISLGETYINESFITGESIPVKKKLGDIVIAGSIDVDGYIEYTAEKIGPESTISEIVRLVSESINKKPKIEKLADKISGYFVPSIFLMAIVSSIIKLFLGYELNETLISFVTILVVACPCALGLATPIANIVTIGKCAKKGILIKSSEILEIASKIDTIIFDKTGTLTYGDLRISTIKNYSKHKDIEILRIVSSIEKNSNHPISKAFTGYKNNLECTDFRDISGSGVKGTVNKKIYFVGNRKILDELKIKNIYLNDEDELSCTGNSIVYIVEDNKVIALIGIKDILRNDSQIIINKLKNDGKKIVLLTGDNKNNAEITGKILNVDEVISEAMPKEKENYIKKLKKKGHYVMMVGDGINDAPSLALSDVSVSINSATDIAINSSNVILMDDDLNKIISLIKISKKTVKIIKENLFWAFFYNLFMISVAIGIFRPFGINISPVIASISMTISSLTVVFNSLRLGR